MHPSSARLRRRAQRSLAAVPVGEMVTVYHVLFDVVRAECAAAGVVAGETVRVAAATPEYVRVRTADGVTVTVDRMVAEFVGVVAMPVPSLQGELALGTP